MKLALAGCFVIVLGKERLTILGRLFTATETGGHFWVVVLSELSSLLEVRKVEWSEFCLFINTRKEKLKLLRANEWS